MQAVNVLWVGTVYAVALVGLHRLNVWRMRKWSGGFATLRWFDWDTVLEGLLHPIEEGALPPLPKSRSVVPSLLQKPVPASENARRDVLCALVEGIFPQEEQLRSAGFIEAEREWLKTIQDALRQPEKALARLVKVPSPSLPQVYLREYLEMTHGIHLLNLEWAVFASKSRVNAAMKRLGEKPALFFVRALASSWLGFNQQAVDDLARAVYFSQTAMFYVEAVLSTPFIREARPELWQQCQRVSQKGNAVHLK